MKKLISFLYNSLSKLDDNKDPSGLVKLVTGRICGNESQNCKNALELASEYFDEQHFVCVENILTQCKPETFPKEEHKIRAYELLLTSIWKIDPTRVQSQEENIDKLLKLDSTQPNQLLFPDGLVEVVKNRKNRFKKWIWIGAGGVASALSAYLLFKPDAPARLPGPPPLPGN